MQFIPNVKEIQEISDKKTKITHIGFSESVLSNEVKNDFSEFCKLPSGSANIFFETDNTYDEEEYAIEIKNGIFKITASALSGYVFALQTIKQILFQNNFAVPDLVIHDKPNRMLRGYMLDVGRYFFSVADVKQIIRRMALHKLNLLHWHLTEDQGWRIEIDAYPLLTEIGSKRSHTNFNRTPHSGYYTKKDIKEIVDYAHKFGIKVMPELDIPGHSRAAIAAYPQLSCFPRGLEVATHWGVKHDVLCVGKDSVFEFIFKVIDEMCELFPDAYFHIGGDEVPKVRWEVCPKCQKRLKELKLDNYDDLQFWFMNKIKDYLKTKGKQSFMWSWDLNNSGTALEEELGFTLCNDMNNLNNRPFIDTSTKAYYIDLPYGKISLKDTADHTVPAGNCLGMEATLWTEYVKNLKKADIMTFPRLAPFSENAWNGQSDFNEIMGKLDLYYAFLDFNHIGYSKPKKAVPNKLRGFFSVLWFEKRQLTWEGLTNIIWDKTIGRK